jgi:hypothetical protein
MSRLLFCAMDGLNKPFSRQCCNLSSHFLLAVATSPDICLGLSCIHYEYLRKDCLCEVSCVLRFVSFS